MVSNNHACPFMCFYNDEKAMGAVKVTAYADGKVSVYVYCNGENSPFSESDAQMSSDDVLKLAVFLEEAADRASRFDKSLDDLEYVEPSAEKNADFKKACESGE